MAAGATYEPIATTTLGSAAASVTFSSIPQGYTDLVLVNNAKSATNGAALTIQFNSDTSTNYSSTFMYGDGSSTTSARVSNSSAGVYGGRCGTEFSSGITHIQNYSNTTTYKSIVSRGSDATSAVIAYASLWRNTSAITSMTIKNESNVNFSSGSTFTLYGITAA